MSILVHDVLAYCSRGYSPLKKREEDWCRNVYRSCFWDRYQGRASQLYATSTFPIMHPPPTHTPKFCITYVFHFSWLLQPSQEKLKIMLMQFFFFWGGGVGGGERDTVHYGKCGSCVLALYFPVPCNFPSSLLASKATKS